MYKKMRMFVSQYLIVPLQNYCRGEAIKVTNITIIIVTLIITVIKIFSRKKISIQMFTSQRFIVFYHDNYSLWRREKSFKEL